MRGTHKRLHEKSEDDVKAAVLSFKRNPSPKRAEQVRAAQVRRWRLQKGATVD